MLLPDVDAAEAETVLERFRTALFDGGIACSIGVACVCGGVLSDVLRVADGALYRAKEDAKGSIVVVDLTEGAAAVAPDAASGS